jgi:pyridoxamine 5'-phosphate oxidase
MTFPVFDTFKNPIDNPLMVLNAWLDNAKEHLPDDFNAMSLATVNYLGQPSVRMVYLKNIIHNNFIFYTNLESKKSLEILDNPHVSACFYWPTLKRSIRIDGIAFKISDLDADADFEKLPFAEQISTWASEQSRHLNSRDALEARLSDYAMQFGDGPVSRPPFWSGYSINPTQIEFWEERPFHLHERLVYIDVQGEWQFSHLYP